MHRCKLQAAWLHGCTRETRKIARWPMAGDGPLGAPLKSTSAGPRLACDRMRLCLMFVTWGSTPYIAIPQPCHTPPHLHTLARPMDGGSSPSQTLARCCFCCCGGRRIGALDCLGPPTNGRSFLPRGVSCLHPTSAPSCLLQLPLPPLPCSPTQAPETTGLHIAVWAATSAA